MQVTKYHNKTDVSANVLYHLVSNSKTVTQKRDVNEHEQEKKQ